MMDNHVDQLAEAVLRAHSQLEGELHGRGPFPRGAFDRFSQSVLEYVEATKTSPLVHRRVAGVLNGFTEVLKLRPRVPGDVLYQADRLECIFFSGYDPSFEGDEPPGP